MQLLRQGLCFAIEATLNKVVPYDISYKRKWQPLQAKTIAVNLTDLQTRLLFRYQNDSFQVYSDDTCKADVTLTGTSMDFFKVALESRQNEAAALQSGIHFEGQVALGQAFAEAIQSMDIDWEEALAQQTDDIFAHRAAQGLRSLTNFADSFFKTVSANFTEYVQEEARLTPTAIEVENFYSDLRELRQDADRIKAKVQKFILTAQTKTAE